MTSVVRGRAATRVKMSDELKEGETKVCITQRRAGPLKSQPHPTPTQKVFENHKRRSETKYICNRDISRRPRHGTARKEIPFDRLPQRKVGRGLGLRLSRAQFAAQRARSRMPLQIQIARINTVKAPWETGQ